MVTMVVLVEPAFKPLPPKLKQIQVFGDECIVDHESKKRTYGQSILIQGIADDIRNWITSNGGSVWVSANPLMGKWEHHTL